MGLQVAAAGKIINEFTGLAFAGGEFETDNPAIRFVSAEAWTKDAQGAHIVFATAPIGSSSPVEGMRLTSEGILLVGTDTASGSAKLQVSGAISVSGITYAGTLALSATGANPITFSSDGTEGFRLAPTTRNLLVGTTTDDGASKLQISNTATSVDIRFGNAAESANAKWVYINGGSKTITFGSMSDAFAKTEYARFNFAGDFLLGGTAIGNYRLDVQSSGSSGTLRVYDQTATTGSTSLVVRAGAGQSTNALVNITANDGTTSVFKVLDTKIGFFNATPVVKQTVTADAASILAALQAYGLAV